MKCKRWLCEWYGEVDDGEDADGYPYPTCPMCYWGGQLQGLSEEWMGDDECIGNFEERKS